MKKIIYFIISLIIILFIILGFLIGLNKNPKDKKIDYVNLGEVTHSPFYTPLYIAIKKDYFKENNIDVNLKLISGANNVTSAVLSGDIDIGFCGPEATIYIYNGKEKDYLQSFAGLTKRDGQFIVSRKKYKNFEYKDLKGKEVLAGRIAGMPELNFENSLLNSKIDISDVKINTTVDFANLSSAFISGTGDFVNLFEPNATKLENMGYGYIVSSIGEKSGEMPYTAFNARKSYINKNKDLIKRFNKAINKAIKYTKENSSNTLTNDIIGLFPDISKNDLEKVIERYKNADTWLDSTYISKENFENLERIMINSKQIENYVPYNKLIVNIN